MLAMAFSQRLTVRLELLVSEEAPSRTVHIDGLDQSARSQHLGSTRLGRADQRMLSQIFYYSCDSADACQVLATLRELSLGVASSPAS